MLLFLMLLMPLSFAIWIFGREENKAPYYFCAFMGLLLAAVFCFYKYFFSPYYFLTPDSFWRNFLHVFLEQIALPLFVLTAAFLFVFKKDKIADRLEKLYPFYAGFYAAYLPFRILNESLPRSAFPLFVKPLLFCLMLLLANARQKVLFVPSKRALLTAREAAVNWALFAVELMMPAAIEALWILGMKPPLTILLLLIYAAAACFCLAKKAGQKD